MTPIPILPILSTIFPLQDNLSQMLAIESDKYMNDSIASIFLKLSCKGRKSVNLGAIYREHRYIRQEEPNLSGSIAEQNKRWNIFTDQWIAASSRSDTIFIGDLNLDLNKWSDPDQDHLYMTNPMKNKI